MVRPIILKVVKDTKKDKVIELYEVHYFESNKRHNKNKIMNLKWSLIMKVEINILPTSFSSIQESQLPKS